MNGPRFVVALLVGVTVFGIALLSAWRSVPGLIGFAPWHTRADMKDIHERIAQFRLSQGRLPESLAELRGAEEHLRVDENGQVLDGWGNPFLYTPKGSTYSLVSLGRDGRPGGVGLDRDVSRPDDPPSRPTLQQFMFEMRTEGVVFSSAVAGILTFLLSLVALWRTDPLGGAARLLFIALASVLASSCMAVLHVSQH